MHEAWNALELIEGKLIAWAKQFIEMLPNLALAAVIVVIGWLIARVVRKGVQRLLANVTDSGTLRRLSGTVVYLTINFIALFAALSIIHLDKTVTSILAGAGILGLALGFAFQDIAANFISGIILAMQRPIRVGELIFTGGHRGVVKRLDLRTTELVDLQGVQVIIPNKEIFQSVLMNYSRYPSRRIDLKIGVSYNEDLARVKQVTTDAVSRVTDVLVEEGIDLFYQSFGDSSIDFEVRFWISSKSNRHFHTVRSAAIMAIKTTYDKEGITIPFPIRTLDLGIKGGEKLDAMLSERPRA
ncbi:MAG: mechanosensitive ion channel family protein [Flavobacteriales bacterium]|nr:mechanosensitive ion channel family protein [Flavobacteriales bacterium]